MSFRKKSGSPKPPTALSVAASLNPWAKGRLNQKIGAKFEAFVAHMARREGLLIIFNGLKAKRLPDRVIGVRSNLDVFCAGDASRNEVLLADCKSFAGARFGQGMLTAHQRQLALTYAQHNLLSGFLVHLRAIDHVGFYPARLLTRVRAGFGPEDAVTLGTLQNFSIARVWEQHQPLRVNAPATD